ADETRGVRLPRLLLQPLVENAVKHGALRRHEGGEIAVRTALTAAHTVTCVVEDNGPGPAAPRDGAIGLALVTRRLAVELDGKAAFRLERAGDRTRSIVELPAEGARGGGAAWSSRTGGSRATTSSSCCRRQAAPRWSPRSAASTTRAR